jgi:hypothetical protein
MAKTDPVNTAVPAGTENPRQGDDRIRALARATFELVGVDHFMDTPTGSAYDSDDAGKHSKVTFAEVQDSKPTIGTDKGIIYAKGATPELYYEDSAGNEKQLTNAGKLNILDADGAVVKTGAQTIAGVKTFSDAPVFSAGANCGSQKLTSVADPTAAQDAVTKAHLESKIGIGAFNPTAYAGGESVTLPNGTIIKGGYVASTGTSKAVTFEAAFPNEVVTLQVTTVKNSTLTTHQYHIQSGSVSKTGFTVETFNALYHIGFYWMAIGR